MLVGDFDRAAAVVLRAAGFGTSEAVSPLDLAHRLLGPGTVRLIELPTLPGDGAIARVRQEWRIYIRAGCSPEAARFAICHELSHWTLGSSACEDDCDSLGAALLAPREAFVNAVAIHGRSLRALARHFCCTESFAALRLGEVTGNPLALVSPSRVRVRGRPFLWPPDPILRQAARGRELPGLRAGQLSDDPCRVVFSVAA